MAPITESLRKRSFQWTSKVAFALKVIKDRMSFAPILGHLDFSKVFEVTCDGSGYSIDGVLS